MTVQEFVYREVSGVLCTDEGIGATALITNEGEVSLILPDACSFEQWAQVQRFVNEVGNVLAMRGESATGASSDGV
jgi:hypothetical protein